LTVPSVATTPNPFASWLLDLAEVYAASLGNGDPAGDVWSVWLAGQLKALAATAVFLRASSPADFDERIAVAEANRDSDLAKLAQAWEPLL
jgi:hypothetical protein